jgi:PncC family amidohydrolase
VAHRVTNVPGSSDYFLGGVVAYANELKEGVLGVRHETIVASGAVSEPVAREMVLGARARLGADVAVAITGIAGPTGGTAEKPVGLGYVALAASGVEVCHRYVFDGDRLENKAALAGAALQLLLDHLDGRKIDG